MSNLSLLSLISVVNDDTSGRESLQRLIKSFGFAVEADSLRLKSFWIRVISSIRAAWYSMFA